MSYTISIIKEWEVPKDLPDTSLMPKVESKEIFSQTVDQIDIKAIISAINNIKE